MANGDVSHADIQDFLDFGAELSAETSRKIDSVCDGINADVNLVLKNLGVALNITDTDSLAWLTLTKKLGAASLSLELLAAQDTEEENTRAQRFWDRYKERMESLVNSGGSILEAIFQTDPRPNNAPTLVGEFDAQQRKRFLRFPQRAAADQYDDEQGVRKTRAGWKQSIGGL